MSIAKLLVRMLIAAFLTWPLVWLGCGLPAMFGVYLGACGHNAYVWLAPAFLLAFALLGFIPYLRFMRPSNT